MALLSVEEALARILTGAGRLGIEHVAVTAARGRVLAEDLTARHTQPPFAASAMDGYAVIAASAARVGAPLSVIGTSQAGRGFAGRIGPGEAVRIFTGAPMPEGADAVIIQEDVTATEDGIRVKDPLSAAGANVRQRGIDFREGETRLTAGRRLDAHAVALAAAMGYAELPVARRPRVAVLATGNELVPPGTTPGPDQIISSNSVGLHALLEAKGADVIDLGIARDTREEISAKIREAAGADVLVTTGGASVGDHDLIGPVLKEHGIDLAFWKVAIRPGKPLLFGTLGPLRVMGLPGNPVSALITARVFLLPLISALLGEVPRPRVTDLARTLVPLPANGPRLQLIRATLSSNGGLAVTPSPSQDSSLLTALAEADCLIIRDVNAPAAAVGDLVTIERLEG